MADLVLPCEPTVISNMETIDIKEEQLDQSIDSVSIQMVHERMNSSSFATVSDKNEVFQPEIVLRHSPQSGVLPSKPTDIFSTENEVFQSKMENEILKLFEEFDMMTLHDYDQTRVIKVRQLVEKFQTITQKGICKLHDETLKVKTNELNKTKEELQMTKTTNLTLSKRIQELEMASNQVSNQKQNFESFDNEEVLEEYEQLEPLKCSKEGNVVEKKSVNKSKRKQSLQENENEFEKSKRKKSSTVPMVNDLSIPMQSCQICNLKFHCGHEISAHYSRVHQNISLKGGEDHQCLLCEKKLSNKESLKRHVRNQHFKKKTKKLRIKKFLCTTCSTNFTSKFNRDRHISALH